MRLRRRVRPTAEQIRAQQRREVERVLADVARGQCHVLVENRWVTAEAAWAAATAILKAWELGGRYDGQEFEPDSDVWLARVEMPDGLVVRAGIGRFADRPAYVAPPRDPRKPG